MADKPTPPAVVVGHGRDGMLHAANPKVFHGTGGNSTCDISTTSNQQPPLVEATSTTTGASSGVINSTVVSPPIGWKRLHANSQIMYVSPSNTALNSLDQVKAYLVSDGTCKCGLECPLDIDKVFNFNPKILTKPHIPLSLGPEDLTKLCNHKRKLLANEPINNKYEPKKKRKGNSSPHSTGSTVVRDNQTPPFNSAPWSWPQYGGNNLQQNPPRLPAPIYSNGYPEPSDIRNVAPPHPPPEFIQQNYSLPHHNHPRFQPHQHHSPNLQVQTSFENRYPQHHQSQQPQPPPHQLQHQQHHQSPIPSNVYEIKYPKSASQPPPGTSLQIHESSNNEPVVAPHSIVPPSQQIIPPSSMQVHTQNGIAVKTPPWQLNKQTSNNSATTVVTPSSVASQQPIYDRVPPLHATPPPVWNNEIRKKQQASNSNHKGSRKRYNAEDSTLEVRTVTNSPSFMDDPSGYLAQQTALLNSTISRQDLNSPSGSDSPQLLVSKVTSSRSHKRFTAKENKKEEVTSTLVIKAIDDKDCSSTVNEPKSIVTTMASGHTVSSNTITSVLAGRANTATVSVNNQKSHLDLLHQNVITNIQPSQEQLKCNNNGQQQIMVSSSGQFIVSSTPKINNQQVLSQPTVLVNGIQGPLLLQSGMVMDSMNTVQIPQIVGNVMQSPILQADDALLSPDSKRKLAMKRRKLSPNSNNAMLLSPQNNVVLPQQQLNSSVVQALTILPGKSNFPNQQVVAANVIQPLSVVQNVPIQQFIVPAGMSGMIMPDGTILQDTLQLNLLAPVQNTFNNTIPGMVIRSPNSAGKVLPTSQYINSPNHLFVNNNFSGQISPILSPPVSSGVVQHNTTTIVQQTTMVSNQHQTSQVTPTNYIIQDNKPFILTSDNKQNFILSPSNDKIIINNGNLCNNYILSNIDNKHNNFTLQTNNSDKTNNPNGSEISVVNNTFEKNLTVAVTEKKNSVSTQTQNQVVQVSSSGTGGSSLMVTTSSAMCQTTGSNSSGSYTGSPPDTTTLSPINQEVSTTTSLHPSTSPDLRLPMVHCISSSNEDHMQMTDSYGGSFGKTVTYVESSCVTMDDKDASQMSADSNYSTKVGLCSTTTENYSQDSDTQ